MAVLFCIPTHSHFQIIIIYTYRSCTNTLQEGCNALIHSLPDGRLNLRQVYFYDTELELFSEPEVIGKMPTVPL